MTDTPQAAPQTAEEAKDALTEHIGAMLGRAEAGGKGATTAADAVVLEAKLVQFAHAVATAARAEAERKLQVAEQLADDHFTRWNEAANKLTLAEQEAADLRAALEALDVLIDFDEPASETSPWHFSDYVQINAAMKQARAALDGGKEATA